MSPSRPEPASPDPARMEKNGQSDWPPSPDRTTPHATAADQLLPPPSFSPDMPSIPAASAESLTTPAESLTTPAESPPSDPPPLPPGAGPSRRRTPPPGISEPDFSFGRKKGPGQLRDQFFGPGAGRGRRPGGNRYLCLILLLLLLAIAGAVLAWLKYSGKIGRRPAPANHTAVMAPPTPVPVPLDPELPPPEILPPNAADLPTHVPAVNTPPPETVADVPLTLDEAGRQLAELGREVSDHPLWLRLLGQSAILERAVSAMDFLAAGERPLPALDFLKSPQAFAADRSGGSLRQSAASLNRYTPLCRMFAALPADKLAALYRKLEPALQQACENLGYRDQTVRMLLTRACTTILSCPVLEQEEELVSTGTQGRFRWARPELEGLNKAEKLFLRLGAKNGALVRQQVEKTAMELQLFSE